jgi:hypothetical protein
MFCSFGASGKLSPLCMYGAPASWKCICFAFSSDQTGLPLLLLASINLGRGF